MSCFDLDFLNGITNKYETNHFHIVLDGESHVKINDEGKIDTSELTPTEYGILLHEYIHYIQHLLTLFGLNRCKMFNYIFGTCIHYMNSIKRIELPLIVENIDNGIQHYYNHLKAVQGTRTYSKHHIDEVEVSSQELEIAKRNNSSVRIGIYDFENDEAVDNEILFGYWAIIESMAHMIQCMVDPDVDNRHKEVPYRLVELVCKNQYPTISYDKRLMITLCFCSLMFENPGVAFFDLANDFVNNNISDGKELYSRFVNSITIKYKNAHIPMYHAIPRFLDELISSVENTIGGEVQYLKRISASCKQEINSGHCFLINMLYDSDSLFSSNVINTLTSYYGIPLIQSKNAIIIPNKSETGASPYPETARLLGFELLYKRVTSKEGTKCSWYDVCKTTHVLSEQEKDSSNTDNTTIDCLSTQWYKKETCLMTQAIKFYISGEKEFVQI